MRTKGIDLENGGGPLLDLRFADGILVFATSSQQATCLLDELVVAGSVRGPCEQRTYTQKQSRISTDFHPPRRLILRRKRL